MLSHRRSPCSMEERDKKLKEKSLKCCMLQVFMSFSLLNFIWKKSSCLKYSEITTWVNELYTYYEAYYFQSKITPYEKNPLSKNCLLSNIITLTILYLFRKNLQRIQSFLKNHWVHLWKVSSIQFWVIRNEILF